MTLPEKSTSLTRMPASAYMPQIARSRFGPFQTNTAWKCHEYWPSIRAGTCTWKRTHPLRFRRRRVHRVGLRSWSIDARADVRRRHSYPRALLVFGRQLYVANAPPKNSKHLPSGSITVYPLGSFYPYHTITAGIHTPDALAVDSAGNLYVANLNGHDVSVYAPGGSVPIRTITDGASSPRALAIGPLRYECLTQRRAA